MTSSPSPSAEAGEIRRTHKSSARVFVPGSIGNVGPGFDVLGLAFDGVGDLVTITRRDDDQWTVTNRGRDAGELPVDPAKNTAAVAARALWEGVRGSLGLRDPDKGGQVGNLSHTGADIIIEKGLPLSGGLGGSAASSVAGAAAASLLLFGEIRPDDVLQAAIAGESLVSGRHADNLLPSLFGGLTLVRSMEPLDYARLKVAADWWIALVTPSVRIETRAARAILPQSLDREIWVQQMANTAMMVHAFAAGDGDALRRSLDDRFAEPARKALIPHFDEVKRAALDSGSIGCSISGSGPSVFAIAPDEETASRCARGMQRAFGEVDAAAFSSPIARTGAREA